MRKALRQGTRHHTHRILSVLAGLSLLAAGLWSVTGAQDQDQDRDFVAWLAALRAEALTLGISVPTLDAALPGLRLQPRVVALDRKQPEGTLTHAAYIARVLPTSRLLQGTLLLKKHQTLLQEIGQKYGVQPRFIVALWGIESNFGWNTGGFPVLASLATLAYDGRRSALFRSELFEALRIVDEGDIRPDAMTGSWAGAMGQSQFMPSSFRRFAIDYDSDGRRDIWRTLPDIFASMANYLARTGWQNDQTWGRPVTLPPDIDPALSDLKITKLLGEWQTIGVRRDDGSDLPTRPLHASLVLPNGVEGPAFLVYDNYRVLLKWNRSHYFATAVGQFADHLFGK